MTSPAEAQALLEELAAHDEAVVTGDEVQLRRRRSEETWRELAPRVFAALATLRLKRLQIELRTFTVAGQPAWRLLDDLALPSLEQLDLGLLYSKPEPKGFTAWFTAFKARHPLLQSTQEPPWREAGTPRVTTVDLQGRQYEEAIQPGGGVMQCLRLQTPDDNPFEVPMLGVRREDDVGLFLEAMNLPADAVVLHNGRVVPLLTTKKRGLRGPELVHGVPRCVLVDGDRVTLGAVQFVVHEVDLAGERAAKRARLPVSPGLDALRARRPPAEERLVGDWPFLSVPEGERRFLASMTQTGDLVELEPDGGLEGIRQAMTLLDPAISLSGHDASWLVKHFKGWEVLASHPESAEKWLMDDGVSRTTVFIGDDTLRLTVGRREEATLRMRGELALLEVPRRGEVKVARQDAFEAVAPPLFQGLVDRFSHRAADALWRFRHFRREGRGVQANVKTERIDVGPFTWVELEADGWQVAATAMKDQALELFRRRLTEEPWQLWERGPELISTLLKTVDREAITDDHVFGLFARFDLGDVLAEPEPVREGQALRFVVKHDDGIQQDAPEDVVVDLETCSVRFESRRRRR